MKKMIILVAFLALSVLTSCSSDDNQESLSVDAEIYGTWSLKEEWKDNVALDLNNCRMQETYTFLENGNFSAVYDDDGGFGDPNNCDISTITGTYTLSGNTLTFTFQDGGEVEFPNNVLELSTNNLILTFTTDGSQYKQRWER